MYNHAPAPLPITQDNLSSIVAEAFKFINNLPKPNYSAPEGVQYLSSIILEITKNDPLIYYIDIPKPKPEPISFDKIIKKFIRQQLVMDHLMNAIDNPKLPLKKFKIKKNLGFVYFGISFHAEELKPFESEHKLVFPLIKVEPNSPAKACGLMSKQRVVWVNDLCINNELGTLVEVLNAVEDSNLTNEYTEFKIIESELWDQYMENPKLAEAYIPKCEHFTR